MARRTATINKKPERAVIIGAGITEKYYFSHLQSLYNLKIKIRPRYFGNENISTLEKLIKQVLDNEGLAIASSAFFKIGKKRKDIARFLSIVFEAYFPGGEGFVYKKMPGAKQ